MPTRDLPDDAKTRLVRPLRLTRWGMVAERLARAFWPLATVVFAATALVLSGVLPALPGWTGQGLAVLLVLGALVGLVWGARAYCHPTKAEACARLDATLPGQPIAALADEQAIGSDDPASRNVWTTHLSRMAQRLSGARAVPPDPDLARRDPFALRLIALTAVVAAGFFGLRTAPADLAALVPGAGPGPVAEASWEGWIEPPSYTGKPTLYLADQPPGALIVPTGSRVTLRLYGKLGAIDVTESFSGETPAEPVPTRLFKIEGDGVLTIGAESWQIAALPDAAPQVQPDGELSRTIAGEMRLPFHARDDYGVSAGQARIALDLDRVDRRFGLAPEPELRDAIVVDLPMPYRGDRSEITELLVENLSEHPWAELPVTITLAATDAAGQTGESAPVEIVLPGRRFLNPLAGAIVEMRRDILWSVDNARRAARILRAVSNRPDGLFSADGQYLRLRTAVRGLEGEMTPGTRDEVAAALWDLAVEIEDGSLSDALERLRRAQERLSEAMRQGASPDELSELMEEYREALRDYTRQLAERGGEDGEREQAQGETMEMTSADIAAMMDRIEELMRQGRTEEAQQMLDMLQQMMENMQVTEGGPGQDGQSPGAQAMEGLQDTLREQQGLSDEAFRRLQQQGPGQGQQGQPGEGESESQPGQPGPGEGQDSGEGEGRGEGEGEGEGRSLAERQRDLEGDLGRQRDGLPGAGTPEGRAAREALERSGRAMDEAAEALEGGDTSGALDRQAEAMEALREGMRGLDEAMRREAQNRAEGDQGAAGGQPRGTESQDPLGRNPGGSGATASDGPLAEGEDVYRRAQELMEELRRRAGETGRPDIERDYLKRLLDLF